MSTTPDMRVRHAELLQALDELIACYVQQRRGPEVTRLEDVPGLIDRTASILGTTLGDFLEWTMAQAVNPGCTTHLTLLREWLALKRLQYSGFGIDDPELGRWLDRAAAVGGGFLSKLAGAALNADGDNYRLLRPALLAMKAKYPKYAKEGE